MATKVYKRCFKDAYNKNSMITLAKINFPGNVDSATKIKSSEEEEEKD